MVPDMQPVPIQQPGNGCTHTSDEHADIQGDNRLGCRRDALLLTCIALPIIDEALLWSISRQHTLNRPESPPT